MHHQSQPSHIGKLPLSLALTLRSRSAHSPSDFGSEAGSSLVAASGGGASSAREESPGRAARPGGDPPAKVRGTPPALRVVRERPSRRATPFAFVPGSSGPGMDSRGPERDRIPGSTCGSTCAPRARQGRGAEVSGCCERKAGGHLAGRARGAGRLLRTVGARFADASISVHTSSKPGDVV